MISPPRNRILLLVSFQMISKEISRARFLRCLSRSWISFLINFNERLSQDGRNVQRPFSGQTYRRSVRSLSYFPRTKDPCFCGHANFDSPSPTHLCRRQIYESKFISVPARPRFCAAPFFTSLDRVHPVCPPFCPPPPLFHFLSGDEIWRYFSCLIDNILRLSFFRN